MSWLSKLLFGAFVVIGAAVIKFISDSNGDNKSKPDRKTEDKKPTPPVIKYETVENTGSSVQAEPMAREVIQKNMKSFVDLYEPMYQVYAKACVLEDAVAVFEEWEQRISDITDSGKLKEKWDLICGSYKTANTDKISAIAFRWINQLGSYGISRDTKNEVQIYDDIKPFYDSDDGKPLVNGNFMIVKQGCWFFNRSLLCRGVLKAKEGNM